MRICKVSIENYRNIKKVDVELGSIVTLIGENNSGKSNFLRAIALPLTFDDSNFGKRLTWYDINKEAKDQYYKYIIDHRESIVNGTMDVKEFVCHVPIVQIILYFQPKKSEHYDVKDILVDKENWIGGIKYRFYLKKPEELLKRVSSVLNCHNNDTSIQMSLLPMELFDYSLTVPGKENKVPFDTISRFRSVVLPAERDSFASNADRLGSKALSDLFQDLQKTSERLRLFRRGF